MTITLTREEAQQVLECMETAIKAGDWVVDGACDPDFILYMLRARLSAPEPEQIEIETLKQCLFQLQEASKEQTKAFDRLVRIMGTFDLATGHADDWSDLLDSLESELRDVLGYYREALKARQEPEPVAWAIPRPDGLLLDIITPEEHESYEGEYTVPLYTAPPQREWQGLTDEEIYACSDTPWTPTGLKCIRAIEAKLKEKNT